ncbi:unnamed protein product, partial [Discosporangium mesarthrocarpum]
MARFRKLDISEVSRDTTGGISLSGKVVGVVALRDCMPADSQTQDEAIVGDGPIDGATKVFEVVLRDVAAAGPLHIMKVYFYDLWAEKCSFIARDAELTVSGPATLLVRNDPSATGNDHPCCLALDPSTPAPRSGWRGGGDIVVRVLPHGSLTAVKVEGALLSDFQVPGPIPQQPKRRGSTRKTQKPYEYTELANVPGAPQDHQQMRNILHVYGVVCSFSHRSPSRGSDWYTTVCLIDPSCPGPAEAVPCNFFLGSKGGLPRPLAVGDILRVHRIEARSYKNRPQLVGLHGKTAWMLVRHKGAIAAVSQTGEPGAASICGGGSVGGGGGDDSNDSGEDEEGCSPPSGPDAGGGEDSTILPSREWDVYSSSSNPTVGDVDLDRCV